MRHDTLKGHSYNVRIISKNHHIFFRSKRREGREGGETKMNRKILALATVVVLGLTMFLAIAPAMAKTRTDVYVRQMGGTNFAVADPLDTPNGRMHFRWGGEGSGAVTLYEDDKTTIIDRFASSSEVDVKGKDSTSLGFIDGVLVGHLKMLWTSNTHAESGFEGVAQWRATADTPHVVSVTAIYQGFGYYQGQLLQLEGTWAPGVGQTLIGTLLA
jgi:hypothetical protein